MSDLEPTKTAKFVKNFIENVDTSKVHTLENYHKIITNAFNSTKEKTVRNLSQYHIFMKDRMKELKQENPDKIAKDIMKMAAAEWTSKKNQTNQA
jgi:hypothetical protein